MDRRFGLVRAVPVRVPWKMKDHRSNDSEMVASLFRFLLKEATAACGNHDDHEAADGLWRTAQITAGSVAEPSDRTGRAVWRSAECYSGTAADFRAARRQTASSSAAADPADPAAPDQARRIPVADLSDPQ